MSLTSLLDQTDVRKKFREVFRLPPLGPLGEMRVAPLTKNYSFVGTAFDYLLRFTFKHRYPTAHTKPWIAESVLRIPWFKQHPEWEAAHLIVEIGRMVYQTYLEDGRCTNDLLYTVLCLAQLDPIFRRKVVVPDLGEINTLDITNLRALLDLVPADLYAMQEICLLNPTFGIELQLVGGADVDIVIDDAIIDIKTIRKPLGKQRESFNQVMGYYLLSRIGGITGTAQSHTIKRVGMYLSRYGVLRLFDLKPILADINIESFTDWLVQRAEQEFGLRCGRV
jgi:hypothetical protein